ncbi:FAD-dependent oxidoreductase [Rhodovulum sulfidophilum]|uniref:FAD-dependent oxidoreductase n=1 Tax=Rhodovulum sulfidophilum TaxID=35806 RepID=UPI00095313FD|nr:FAD-dependent oxidoreductase [Rhodovulum sulfidophilum]MBL3554015.1 FAD-dependent oxidoreductase [Rhodovulum sulfidophilum]OLS49992.1 pyridine nucleotide-disulfide oxidoreductase [Rhodovulum sulfidophilum]
MSPGPQLVLIGGGHAHALVLRGQPLPSGLSVTLIDPSPKAAYSGMLPGFIAGHYPRAALEIDLARLASAAGARFVIGRAEGLDRARRHVLVAGQAPVPYDILSLDIGITSDLPDLAGFADHAVPAKPLGHFADRWPGFLAGVAAGHNAPRVAVIGAGVAGVELALAARYRLARDGAAPEVTLIDAADEILRELRPGARAALLSAIGRAGIALRTGGRIARIGAEGVTLATGETIPAAFVIGAAGARPQGWLAETGLGLTDGFVTVDRTLRSVSDPRIFAAGDCAHLSHAPRPKAGVFAVREAPILRRNLIAALTGGRMRAYRPQRHYLKLVSMGEKRAAADRLALRIEGRWVWRWKDRIDRGFMRRFQDLPPAGRP